ncbi:radical SAM domain-containing protein [Gottschalkia purinilytica]|uniref:Radical SAM domain-containing protein n=1 Tax=Gottschalkia purinilytica TaxID=1503 RepID=A0A0L0WB03_GOTPU|nr:radical SAM protein [Gottschalkia purinilytica]KNF08681.1 radical SAM domain-containing protein [Gottschalkia purinilytica]
MFDKLLKTALESDITPEIALQILQESKEQKNALKLFESSSRLRDEKIGKDLWLSSGISGVIPCKVVPKCTYCTYFTTESFQIDKLSLCVKEIEKLGIKHIHLSGGTNIEGYDKEIISMIESIRKVSDIDIEINLGPSFSEETVKIFRDLDVKSITSSLEIFNEDLFKKAKPGDSLDDIPLWHLAGGGNQVLGCMVSRRPAKNKLDGETIQVSDDLYIINRISILENYIKDMDRRLILN